MRSIQGDEAFNHAFDRADAAYQEIALAERVRGKKCHQAGRPSYMRKIDMVRHVPVVEYEALQ